MQLKKKDADGVNEGIEREIQANRQRDKVRAFRSIGKRKVPSCGDARSAAS